jgi:hypothetical protein
MYVEENKFSIKWSNVNLRMCSAAFYNSPHGGLPVTDSNVYRNHRMPWKGRKGISGFRMSYKETDIEKEAEQKTPEFR